MNSDNRHRSHSDGDCSPRENLKASRSKGRMRFRTRKCSELLKFKDSWSLLPYRPARDFPLPVEIATQEEPLNLPRAEAGGDCSQESVKHPMVKVRFATEAGDLSLNGTVVIQDRSPRGLSEFVNGIVNLENKTWQQQHLVSSSPLVQFDKHCTEISLTNKW